LFLMHGGLGRCERTFFFLFSRTWGLRLSIVIQLVTVSASWISFYIILIYLDSSVIYVTPTHYNSEVFVSCKWGPGDRTVLQFRRFPGFHLCSVVPMPRTYAITELQ